MFRLVHTRVWDSVVLRMRRRSIPVSRALLDKVLALSSISFPSFSKSLPAKPLQYLSNVRKNREPITVHVPIVEDDQTDQVILGDIIEGAGHKAYFASDGRQAFKLCMRQSIDIVITDLHMPRVDGLVLIRTLRSIFPEAPIIAVSGKGPELLAGAKRQGAFAALTKPVDPHELLAAIAQAPLPRLSV